MARTLRSQWQRTWVPSLVGELDPTCCNEKILQATTETRQRREKCKCMHTPTDGFACNYTITHVCNHTHTYNHAVGRTISTTVCIHVCVLTHTIIYTHACTHVHIITCVHTYSRVPACWRLVLFLLTYQVGKLAAWKAGLWGLD